jgi:spoIIIJ-associated protein
MSQTHMPSGRRFTKRPNAQQTPLPRLDAARAAAELHRFAELAVREMGLALTYEIATPPSASDSPANDGLPKEGPANENRTGGQDVTIAFRGDDDALLLENDAELLLALEHIAHRWLRLDPRLHDRVRFDCGDFRSTRLDELKLSARVAAQRVRETGQEFRFNPMSSRERRLIHLELTGAAGVRTASEGVGDHRQLVIYPTGKKAYSR